jgi:WD40 repeat protein
MIRAALVVALASVALPAAARAVVVYHRAHTNQIVAARNDGSRPHVVASGQNARVSPNGCKVLFARHVRKRTYPDLRLVSVLGGRSRLLLHDVGFGDGFSTLHPSWSPNSRSIVAGDASDGAGYLFDAKTRRRTDLQTYRTGLAFTGASFSVDSSRLAVELSDVRDTKLFLYRRGHRGFKSIVRGMSPVWGRGGIAFSTDRGLELVPRLGAPKRLLVADTTASVQPVAWSAASGRLLAARESSNGRAKALLVTPATKRVVTFSQDFSEVDALSRDGKRVLGVVDGDVVAAAADGSSQMLAAGADNASWNR